ncbi:MAG: histidine kinase [Bacteroidales bacterium]|nr:histidine kinase [Bacteroidales bacterium]
MEHKLPINKLIRIGLYFSPLIGTLTAAPEVVNNPGNFHSFLNVMLLFTLLSVYSFFINVILEFLAKRFSNPLVKVLFRYATPYLICFITVIPFLNLIKPEVPVTETYRILKDGLPVQNEFIVFGPIVLCLVLNTIVIIIKDLIILKETKSQIEFENAQLRIKNVEATNQQLKQQIQPHFLFNSLNTLKSMIKKEPDEAEKYLIRLSEFLRHSISIGSDNISSLKDEITLCEDYMALQKTRFREALFIEINIPNAILNAGFVPVFSILPLLENAIKHNILTMESPLFIKVYHDQGRIRVVNTLQPKQSNETGTGFGLENLAERYKIISGDQLFIEKTEDEFNVSIKILVHENSNN